MRSFCRDTLIVIGSSDSTPKDAVLPEKVRANRAFHWISPVFGKLPGEFSDIGSNPG